MIHSVYVLQDDHSDFPKDMLALNFYTHSKAWIPQLPSLASCREATAQFLFVSGNAPALAVLQ